MLNAGAISVVTDRVRAEGDTTLQLQARGTMQDPNLMGTVTLRDGTAVSEEPHIAAENVEADIALEGNVIRLTSLKGDVNGGTLEGSGTVTLARRHCRHRHARGDEGFRLRLRRSTCAVSRTLTFASTSRTRTSSSAGGSRSPKAA
jgi:autotransporter translocation and assembly factor TamB